MADTEALQETLFKEMKGRIKEDDSTVPAPDGAYAYFTSYVVGGQHPRICRQPRDGGEADGAARWRRDGCGQAVLLAGRGGLEPRPPADGLCLRRQGLGVLQDQAARPRDGPGACGRGARYGGRAGLERRWHGVLLHARGRVPPPAAGLAAPRWRRSGAGRADLSRSPMPASSRASTEVRTGASSS